MPCHHSNLSLPVHKEPSAPLSMFRFLYNSRYPSTSRRPILSIFSLFSIDFQETTPKKCLKSKVVTNRVVLRARAPHVLSPLSHFSPPCTTWLLGSELRSCACIALYLLSHLHRPKKGCFLKVILVRDQEVTYTLLYSTVKMQVTIGEWKWPCFVRLCRPGWPQTCDSVHWVPAL